MATSVVIDAYQALLADMKKAAMQQGEALSVEIPIRGDDERVTIVKIRSDVSGGLTWIDGAGTQIPEETWMQAYVHLSANRIRAFTEAREALHNSNENYGAIRDAKGQYIR